MEKEFFALARKQGENPRFFVHAIDLEGKSKKYVLITDQSFWFARKIDHVKHSIYCWLLLTKLYKTEDTISMIFGKNQIKFETDKVDEIFEVLWDILPRIFRPTELISLGYFTDPDERPPPTSNSVMIRLNLRQKLLGKEYSSQTIQRIQEILEYSEEYIDLNSFSNKSEAFPVFFHLLPLCYNILSIKITSSESIDAYKVLRDVITEPSNLEHMEIVGPSTHHFDSFLRKLTQNKNIPIAGLTFTNSNFSEKNILSIIKCFTDKYLCSVGFHNAISSSSIDSLYSAFFPKFCNKLTVLSLDHTKNLNLSKLNFEFTNLEMISLKECDLEIYEILKAINREHFVKLRGLDVSYNKCTKAADGLYDLPPTLITIVAAGIKWPESKLVEFFKIITINDLQKRIDLSAIEASEEDMTKLYNFMKEKQFPQLKALIWDENYINSDFFVFLNQNPQIEFLSLNYCFSEKDQKYVDSLCKFISSSNVHAISIQGDEKNHIGELIIPIINSACLSKTLEHINLEGSYCGDKGLFAAQKILISDTPICSLNLEGSHPKYPQSLFFFLYKAAGGERGIAVSFPLDDINELFEKKQVTKGQVDWIKTLYKHQQSTVKETMSPLEFPFEIYRENWKPYFPLYLKPVGPSPDGVKTEDMFNTDFLSDERTQLTISVDGDEIKLIPIQKEKESSPVIKPQKSEDIKILETADLPKEKPKSKSSNVKKVVSKKKKVVKRKRESSSKEKSSSNNSQNKGSSSNKGSEISTSEKGSSKKKSRSSSRHSRSSRILSSSSGANINLESSPRRDSSILSGLDGSKDDFYFIWDFPSVCRLNFDEIVQKIYTKAEENYEINLLTELIPK